MTASPDTEPRRWPILMLVLIVIALSFATGVLVRQVSTLHSQVSSLHSSIDRIDETVDRIEESSTRTEAAADELVAFVHEFQAQQPQQGSSQTQQAVQKIIDVLCASSDPVRQKACAELTGPGG